MRIKTIFKALTLAAMSGATTIDAGAVIADSTPRTVVQPDGSQVTLTLHGDEFYNFTTSADGSTVVFNPQSRAWEYAAVDLSGQLYATGVAAANGRVAPQQTKGLRPKVTAAQRAEQAERRLHSLKTGQYDYTKFRGLVILVEYNDAPFSRADVLDVFTEMVNKSGYDGYMTDNLLPSKVAYTGSVRDYYYDNSGGRFDPNFDVVGPVKIDYSQHDAMKSNGAQMLVTAALRAADEQLDYTLYDTDGNKEVDMVYFIFSGAGSNFSGNDPTLLWPHASQVMSLTLDGVRFGRYACSTELYGIPNNRQLDGIGTICHEFSHVLGLPDLYDVDYETGGQAIHPQRWSIMASGSYLNMSRTPCGYSLFERMALGFASPVTITEPGEYEIRPSDFTADPEGYRINTAIKEEYFLLENRKKVRWDEYLPGEGMLIHRVDSTNTSIWENNKVNASPNHTYYTLLRANPKMGSSTSVTDTDGDPFPGSGNVTAINNSTTPSLRSWTASSSALVLEDIARSTDGTISFKVIEDDVPTLVEDFQTMEQTTADTTAVAGRFTNWDFGAGARVVRDDEGNQYATTVKNSTIACAPFTGEVETCTITVENPTSQGAVFRFYYTTDGTTWRPISTIEGSSNPSAARGATTTFHYAPGAIKDGSFRLMQYTGNATTPCKVTRIEFGLKPGSTAAIGDILPDEAAEPTDGRTHWYNLQGMEISEPTSTGIYIRRQGNKASKVLINP